MDSLVLIPVAAVPRRLLDALGHRLGEHLEVVTRPDRKVDPAEAFDHRRGQFHSTRILDLLREVAENGQRVLGVIDADLFVPILTFVFGEAELGGRAAVISLTRLRPTYYGLPDDPRRFFERVLKEALHEIGHTFGLHHCTAPGCVMRASTSADEVDLKPASFCEDCAVALR